MFSYIAQRIIMLEDVVSNPTENNLINRSDIQSLLINHYNLFCILTGGGHSTKFINRESLLFTAPYLTSVSHNIQ